MLGNTKFKTLVCPSATLTFALLVSAVVADGAAAKNAIPLSCVRKYTRCINACGNNDPCQNRCVDQVLNCKSPFASGRGEPVNAKVPSTSNLPPGKITIPVHGGSVKRR
jgi:hypothetical protein